MRGRAKNEVVRFCNVVLLIYLCLAFDLFINVQRSRRKIICSNTWAPTDR